MSIIILIVYMLGIHFRGTAGEISLTNEIKLKNGNAQEFGMRNSMCIGMLHTIFYGGSIIEAFLRKTQVDYITIIGILLYGFSLVMLFYVIKLLNGFWTTKLILAEDHKLNTSFLFKHIKHPNYFLNLIPELIGFTLVCKSFYVFSVVFPLYIITLIFRIRIEEKMMKTRFVNY